MNASDWLSVLQSLSDRRLACTLVRLIQTKGSTPREVGARMIVTLSDSFGSIGGGALEYDAIEQAREMLLTGGDQKPIRSLQNWHLGADAGQCCGGVCTVSLETVPPFDYSWLTRLMQYRDKEPCILVTPLDGHDLPDEHGKVVITERHVEGSLATYQDVVVRLARTMLKSSVTSGKDPHVVLRQPGNQSPAYLLELFGPNHFRLMLFGAGHVGKAIIRVMSELPCHVTWVDARPGIFPASIPHNVEKVVSKMNDQIIAGAQPGTFFLVMTHSHPLDLELCEHILRRQDFGYLGLIGSKTKRARFEKRLLQNGLGQDEVQRLTCPIGLPEITGKYPGAIAVSVAAQILQQRSSLEPTTGVTSTIATL